MGTAGGTGSPVRYSCYVDGAACLPRDLDLDFDDEPGVGIGMGYSIMLERGCCRNTRRSEDALLLLVEGWLFAIFHANS